MGWRILNLISIYSHPYMKTVKTEYWFGCRRYKVLTFGKYTVWIKGLKK